MKLNLLKQGLEPTTTLLNLHLMPGLGSQGFIFYQYEGSHLALPL